jgi:hypothetical protein
LRLLVGILSCSFHIDSFFRISMSLFISFFISCMGFFISFICLFEFSLSSFHWLFISSLSSDTSFCVFCLNSLTILKWDCSPDSFLSLFIVGI